MIQLAVVFFIISIIGIQLHNIKHRNLSKVEDIVKIQIITLIVFELYNVWGDIKKLSVFNTSDIMDLQNRYLKWFFIKNFFIISIILHLIILEKHESASLDSEMKKEKIDIHNSLPENEKENDMIEKKLRENYKIVIALMLLSSVSLFIRYLMDSKKMDLIYGTVISILSFITSHHLISNNFGKNSENGKWLIYFLFFTNLVFTIIPLINIKMRDKNLLYEMVDNKITKFYHIYIFIITYIFS